jgi:hypothetical protein
METTVSAISKVNDRTIAKQSQKLLSANNQSIIGSKNN